VPGLGFDYPHLAAISGNFPFNPLSKALNVAHVISLPPIFFGGNSYFPGFIDSAGNQQFQQQPQIIVIQQPAPVAVAQPTSPVRKHRLIRSPINKPSLHIIAARYSSTRRG